jgi:hypothetical protein
MAAHTFKHADYIKGGLNTFKANLVPGIMAGILGLIPVLGASVLVNYLRALKEKRTPTVGDLFKMDNLVGNFIAQIVSALGFCCCWVPGAMMIFTMPIMADKPGCQALNAVKGAFAFGKANIVGVIILLIAVGIVGAIIMLPFMVVNFVLGFIASWLPLLFMPVVLGAAGVIMALTYTMIWTAYEDARAQVEASAAEGGVSLA